MPGESHGWRSLVGYSPCGPKELNTAEQLHFHFLWRTVWRFLKKLGIKIRYDPIVLLLGIYSEKTITEKDTCTPVFTAALFTIARTRKHPRCPLTDAWIKL